MQLPESEYIIYERNPLIQVACQLRFPPILKVSHEQPVEFQDEIRSQYPLFEKIQMPFPSQVSQIIQQPAFPHLSSSYTFKSEDQKWQLSITQDSVTIITFAYEKYLLFQRRFKEAVDVFEKIYNPSFYTRVGIQYQDLIIRSKLGLEDKKWSDLITQSIASELYDSEFEPLIQSIMKNLILKTEHGQINFRHGLVIVKEPEKNNNELAYLLDSDFYIEQKMERGQDVWNKLGEFNKSAKKLFRWSITDILHTAMQPHTIKTTEI